jgi:hypothetical protein
MVSLLLPFHQEAGAALVSQQPGMDPLNGYSFSSETQVPSQTADDFLWETPLPLGNIRWWGSYWDTTYQGVSYYPYPNSNNWGNVPNPPGIITGFNINVYVDVPTGAGVPPWGHPGAQVYTASVPFNGSQTTETYFGTITRAASTQTVFQYDLKLTTPFNLQAGMVYWLSIQAIDFDGAPIQWGWQESMDSWNANAVQMGFAPQEWWDLLTGEDMAFELHAVPIPTAVLLLGSGLLGLIGMRRIRNR